MPENLLPQGNGKDCPLYNGRSKFCSFSICLQNRYATSCNVMRDQMLNLALLQRLLEEVEIRGVHGNY